MLVLSRKNGQKIIINDNIEITILESKYDNCKIAINAPRDVKIYREEVYQQIQKSNTMSKDVTEKELNILSNMGESVEAKLDNAHKNKIIIKKKQ